MGWGINGPLRQSPAQLGKLLFSPTGEITAEVSCGTELCCLGGRVTEWSQTVTLTLSNTSELGLFFFLLLLFCLLVCFSPTVCYTPEHPRTLSYPWVIVSDRILQSSQLELVSGPLQSLQLRLRSLCLLTNAQVGNVPSLAYGTGLHNSHQRTSVCKWMPNCCCWGEIQMKDTLFGHLADI